MCQVALKNSDAIDSALESIEKVFLIIARYDKVEDIYFIDKDTTLDEEFESTLIHLYVTILQYQAALTAFFKRSSFSRFVRAFPSLDDFGHILAKVNEADADCRRKAKICDSKDLRSWHEKLLDILDRQNEKIQNMPNSVDERLIMARWKENIAILDWASDSGSGNRHDYLLDQAKMSTRYTEAGKRLFMHPSYVEWNYSGQWYIANQCCRQDIESGGWTLG
jgi:hypothetical protein